MSAHTDYKETKRVRGLKAKEYRKKNHADIMNKYPILKRYSEGTIQELSYISTVGHGEIQCRQVFGQYYLTRDTWERACKLHDNGVIRLRYVDRIGEWYVCLNTDSTDLEDYLLAVYQENSWKGLP